MIGKKKPVYFTNLDELSIWAWAQLHKNEDWGYLVKSGQADKQAPKVYATLLTQFENLQLPVLKAKKRVLVEVMDLIIDIAENNMDFKKLQQAKTVLNAIALSGEHSDWLFKFDFTESPGQKTKLTRLAVAVKAHEDMVKNMAANKGDRVQTLNEKVVAIEQILGIKIDPKQTSVLLFTTYERSAVNKIRLAKNN